jgi:hemin uptake protein HemP
MMTATDDRPRSDIQREPLDTSSRPLRHLVSELLRGEREAILEHNGQDYRLRITASGKLILTK